MKLLILIAAAISLAGCYSTGTQDMAAVNYCQKAVAPGTNPNHVVRDYNGCVLGVDSDPRVRGQILRERGQNNAE